MTRSWTSRIRTSGFDALLDKPHPGLHSALTAALLEQVRAELQKSERTWSGPQIADWLAEEHKVRLSADRVCFHLKRAGISYKRTRRSLKHKQDPEGLQASKATLTTLKGGPKAS